MAASTGIVISKDFDTEFIANGAPLRMRPRSEGYARSAPGAASGSVEAIGASALSSTLAQLRAPPDAMVARACRGFGTCVPRDVVMPELNGPDLATRATALRPDT